MINKLRSLFSKNRKRPLNLLPVVVNIDDENQINFIIEPEVIEDMLEDDLSYADSVNKFVDNVRLIYPNLSCDMIQEKIINRIESILGNC